MKSFFSKEEKAPKDVPSRIKKLSTHDLISWADTTIMLLGKSFDEYHYHDGPVQEVLSTAEILVSILQELESR